MLFRAALAIFGLLEKDILAVTDPLDIFILLQNYPKTLIDTRILMDEICPRKSSFKRLLSQKKVDEVSSIAL